MRFDISEGREMRILMTKLSLLQIVLLYLGFFFFENLCIIVFQKF